MRAACFVTAASTIGAAVVVAAAGRSSSSRARYRVERPTPRCLAMAVMDSPRALAGAGGGQLVRVQRGGPASGAAVGAGGGQAVQGALADQVAFHLGGHGGDHEQHLVGDGLTVGGGAGPAQMPDRISRLMPRGASSSSRKTSSSFMLRAMRSACR
ncbi:hypothetical protein GCM10020219_041270 [Nonomuraea dietziae]